MGRYTIEFGANDFGPGLYGAAISGPCGTFLLILMTYFNDEVWSGIASSLALLVIFFAGGAMGKLIWVVDICRTGSTACGYQNYLMLIGCALLWVSLGLALIVRGRQFESEESIALRKELRGQAISAWLSGGAGERGTPGRNMPLGAMAVSFPRTPQLPHIFIAVSQSETVWKAWRVLCGISIVMWMVFMGGFGAVDGSWLTNDIIVAGIVVAVTGPIALASLTLTISKDSRRLAIFAQLVSILTMMSLGRIVNGSIHISVKGEEDANRGAIACIISGGFLFGLGLLVLWGMALHKLLLPTVSIGLESRLRRDISLAIGFFAAAGCGVYIAGIGTWQQQLAPSMKHQGGLILGAVLSASALAAYCCCHRWMCSVNENQAVENNAEEQISTAGPIPIALTLAAYSQVGDAIYAAAKGIALCQTSGGVSDDLTGPVSVLVGGAVVILSAFAWQVYFLMKAESWEPVEELRGSHWDIRDRMGQARLPAPEAEGDIGTLLNVHTLLLSWPTLQFSIKISIISQLTAYAIFVTAFSKIRRDPSGNPLNSDYSGYILFGVFGITTPLLTMLWICRGSNRILATAALSCIISMSASGYVFFSASQAIASPWKGMVAGAVWHALASSIMFSLLQAPRKLSALMYHQTYASCIQIFAGIAWLLFVVGAGVLIQDRTLQNLTEAATGPEILLIVFPIVHIGLYITDRHQDNLYLRMGTYIFLSFAIWSAGAVFWNACLELSGGTASMSASIAEAIGSLMYIIFQMGAILHRQYAYEEVFLSDAEWSELPWVDLPRHWEETRHWLLAPTSRGLETIARLFFLMVLGGWIAFVIGFARVNLWPPDTMQEDGADTIVTATVYDAFAISTALAAFGWVTRLILRWVSFGVGGTVASLIALSLAGSAVFGAGRRVADSAIVSTIAGAIFVLLGIVMLLVILLHRRDVLIPTRGIGAVALRSIAFIAVLGWGLYVGGFAINTGHVGGGLDPFVGYLLCTIPGAIAAAGIAYEVFIPFYDHWSDTVELQRALAQWKVSTAAAAERRLSNLNRQRLLRLVRKKQPEREAHTEASATEVPVEEGEEQGEEKAAADDDDTSSEVGRPPLIRPTIPLLPEPSHPIRLPNIFFAAVAIIVAGIPSVILSPHLHDSDVAFATATPTATPIVLSRRLWVDGNADVESLVETVVNSLDSEQSWDATGCHDTGCWQALPDTSALLQPTRTTPLNRRQAIETILPLLTSAPESSTTATLETTEPATPQPTHKLALSYTLQFIGSILMIFANGAYIIAIECCAARSDVLIDVEKVLREDEEGDGKVVGDVEEEGSVTESEGSEGRGPRVISAEASSAMMDVPATTEPQPTLPHGVIANEEAALSLHKTPSAVSSTSSSGEETEAHKAPRQTQKAAKKLQDIRNQTIGLTPNTEKNMIAAVRSLQMAPDVRKMQKEATSSHGVVSSEQDLDSQGEQNVVTSDEEEAVTIPRSPISPPPKAKATIRKDTAEVDIGLTPNTEKGMIGAIRALQTIPDVRKMQEWARSGERGGGSSMQAGGDESQEEDERSAVGSSARWLKKKNNGNNAEFSIEEL
ncbi:hypothetical protein HDV00_010251 [Rhizophlyctis rosea]|nr:hypothetical protein HDV00_010251 [Rhizophlyctis rosea]